MVKQTSAKCANYEWLLEGQEIDKTLHLDYIRVGGLHGGCNPVVHFDSPNYHPCTIMHIRIHTVCTFNDEGSVCNVL